MGLALAGVLRGFPLALGTGFALGAAELGFPGVVLGGAVAVAVVPLVGGGAVLVVPVVPVVAPPDPFALLIF